jgi:hypothetical protein
MMMQQLLEMMKLTVALMMGLVGRTVAWKT